MDNSVVSILGQIRDLNLLPLFMAEEINEKYLNIHI